MQLLPLETLEMLFTPVTSIININYILKTSFNQTSLQCKIKIPYDLFVIKGNGR